MKHTGAITKLCIRFLLPLALAGAAGEAFGGPPQGSKTANAADDFSPLIQSVQGADLFRAYCASCHGPDGKGNGPAAAALKTKVPNLTALSMRNGGKFPEANVRQMITGDAAVAAHGSRLMPIWGPVFHQIERDVDRGHVRVQNLVEYLQSIQTVEPAASGDAADRSPSGAKLYQQLCANCHANDLKGNGPAPYPFKDVPPDLSTLARRHGGTFPDAYVSNVLRNGITMPDHGPAEMPIWGADFRAANGLSGADVTQRIVDLESYLKSRQAR
jgi:mono/diheme cytochrome c family protein